MAFCVADHCLVVHWPMANTPPLVDFRVFKHPAQCESENG